MSVRPPFSARLRAAKRELASACLLCAFGGAFFWFGAGLKSGSAAEMGPGYFPILLAGIVFASGLFLAVRSLAGPARATTTPDARIDLRPLVVIAACPLLFGLLIEPVGLFLSTVIAVLAARMAQRGGLSREAFLTATALACFCCALFVGVLDLPFNLWPRP